MKKSFILLLFWCGALLGYDVQFTGITDEKILHLIEANSELVSLKKSPPSTQIGLKRRVENDIPNIIKALHSLAYYNARVESKVEQDLVTISIDLGPVYPLVSFNVESDCLDQISLEDLGITLHTPALPSKILLAEEQLLTILAKNGRPYARVTQREVTANQKEKNITVDLEIDCGPLVYFGQTTVGGLCSVRPEFVLRHSCMKEGKPYNTEKIEKTRQRLETSGLFSSVVIEEGEADGERMPMHISVSEAKHRTIGYGVSYSTQKGPGVAAEWEHRNFRGSGELLSFNANIASRRKEGSLMYMIPNFRRYNQDLIWLAEVENEITDGFHETSFTTSCKLDRKINETSRYSYGLQYKFLRDTHSDNNDDFNLLKTPLEYSWSNVDSILDPIRGTSLYLKAEPSFQLSRTKFAYSINQLSLSCYVPITCKTTLASRAVLGSIIGTSRTMIPPSERFYAGTESLLRGYNYMTVSPLDAANKPIGGRSMMVFSFEPRFRLNDSWGAVCFYEAGNVYSEVLPQFREKMLQDVGVGIRYYTPVGPLRLDFAVPLDRRKKVDSNYQFYFSIGQAF